MKYFNHLISKLIYKIWMIPCQATSVLAEGWPQVAGGVALNEHPM